MNPGRMSLLKFRGLKQEAFTTASKAHARIMKITAGLMLKTAKSIGILLWVIMTAKLTGTASGVDMRPGLST